MFCGYTPTLTLDVGLHNGHTHAVMEAILYEIKTALSGVEATSEVRANMGPGVVELKKNVCYIVVATILDEEGRVLMMREAKACCRGKWYLPAGRMECGESIEAAVVRETLEETGLRIQPTALLCIESQAMYWFRFTFAGSVVEGKLKSEKEQDKESIEAGWFHPGEVMSKLEIRARDIFPLIKIAVKWYEIDKGNLLCRCLPVKVAHNEISVSLVLINKQKNEKSSNLDLLAFKASDRANPSLPVWIVEGLGIDIMTIINKLVERAGHIKHKVHGFPQLEHNTKASSKETDGLHLTVLAEVMSHGNELQEHYLWLPLTEVSLSEKLIELIKSDGCVKLTSMPLFW